LLVKNNNIGIEKLIFGIAENGFFYAKNQPKIKAKEE